MENNLDEMTLIQDYMASIGLSEGAAQRRLAELVRNPDLAAEFSAWIVSNVDEAQGRESATQGSAEGILDGESSSNSAKASLPEGLPAGVSVEGYTAKKISELAPFMNAVGIYNFLVLLREQPEKAKVYITEGFPVL